MISHRINSPTKIPDMVPTSSNRRSTPADRLEFTNLLGQRALYRQPLHRRSAIEAVTVTRVLHDESGVRRLGHRPAMRQHQNPGIDRQRRCRPAVDASGTILKLQRGLRADRAAGGQAEMTED